MYSLSLMVFLNQLFLFQGEYKKKNKKNLDPDFFIFDFSARQLSVKKKHCFILLLVVLKRFLIEVNPNLVLEFLGRRGLQYLIYI